jgi:IS30 family transposase
MTHLTHEDRKIIEKLLNKQKLSLRAIGRALDRSHSVISYEIKMNKGDHLQYNADRAQYYHEQRQLKKGNKNKISRNKVLKQYIIERLTQDQLSPEQIAGRLKRFHKDTIGYVCHETIYEFIYADEQIKEKYFIHLRRHKPKRVKWHTRKKNKKGTIKERVSIHERPEEVDENIEVGHWESDSMIFSQQKGILSVQVERVSKLARLTKCANKSAEETKGALIRTVDSVPDIYIKSITFDNGTENAKHMELKTMFQIQTYFCDPYCSWQKGLVENTNMLIRQYLPLHTPIDKLTDDQIKEIEDKLNNRPRKSLNYLTPNETFQLLTEGGLITPRI